jgi:DMSO/TMAO reductase YedYZ molybdopterin-dependent catalytic subunit
VGGLSARQVNLLLAVAAPGAAVTGLVSWGVGTGWGRWWTAVHGVLGLVLVILAPAKIQRSVRPGLRRGRPGRWLSVSLGVIVVATVGSGVASASGLWTGVGYRSPLWSHVLLAVVSLALLAGHLSSRPVRPHRVDLDRRLLLGGLSAVGVAAVAVASGEAVARAAGTRGADRRFTGSHEVASFDPSTLPTVSWIDDRAPPDTAPDRWGLTIDGVGVAVADLAGLAGPVPAVLDCTGGWWSEQRWDAVAVADLVERGLLDGGRRSFTVTSATGYRRIFPMADAADTYLAVGYDRSPLRSGHGAPVRVVAPARRGPWWVKWVETIESSDRPWWAQSPFPLT